MQMVANGYGVTLVPEVAVDVEVRDERVKLLRFTAPEPGRTIGLGWRRTSPRKADFFALGQIVDRSAGRPARSKAAQAPAWPAKRKKAASRPPFLLIARLNYAARYSAPAPLSRGCRSPSAFCLASRSSPVC